MRILAVGPDAVLVDLGGLDAVDAVRRHLHAALAAGRLAGVREIVPAARTVLVHAPGAPGVLDTVAALLADVDLSAPPASPETASPETASPGTGGPGAPVELRVHYDGVDLARVADEAGLDPADVVARHTGRDLTVAFGGFAPGFAYLSGLDPLLQRPRLDRPRERVPAGSVGVAGEFGGVYPRASPGGWRLLGRLADDAPTLFDPRRDPPALLVPGTRVRFRDADR